MNEGHVKNRTCRKSLADKLQLWNSQLHCGLFELVTAAAAAAQVGKTISNSSTTIYRVAILVNRVLSLLVKWNAASPLHVLMVEKLSDKLFAVLCSLQLNSGMVLLCECNYRPDHHHHQSRTNAGMEIMGCEEWIRKLKNK